MVGRSVVDVVAGENNLLVRCGRRRRRRRSSSSSVERRKRWCSVVVMKLQGLHIEPVRRGVVVEKELGGGGSGLQHGPRLGLGGLHGKPERSVSSSSSDDVDVEVEVGVGG